MQIKPYYNGIKSHWTRDNLNQNYKNNVGIFRTI